MKSITSANLADKTFDPSTISIPKKASTARAISILFARSVTIEFDPSLLRIFPANINCFGVSKNHLKMIKSTIFKITSKLLDNTCGIHRSLEIFLEDCLVPNIPTSNHESCLPLRIGISVSTLVEVCKNPIPAIKGKKNQLYNLKVQV